MNPRRNMHLWANPGIFKNAYSLRQNLTPAEKILWEHIKDRKIEGIRFRRQHPIRNYIADFYAHEIKFIIELDGAHHHDPSQMLSDTDRSEILNEYKITIIRFNNEEVFNHLSSVLEAIRQEIVRLLALK